MRMMLEKSVTARYFPAMLSRSDDPKGFLCFYLSPTKPPKPPFGIQTFFLPA